MTIRLLSERRADHLRQQPLTYPEVGQTQGTLPEGYHHTGSTRQLGPGADFESVVQTLISWRMHAKAGLSIEASSTRVEIGSVVVMRLGPGPLAITIPCRVVYTVDEPHRRGFAYGTLPGHPESGEESFVLSRRPDGTIIFIIDAFSRPATMLSRLGGPLSTAFQRLMTRRYLHAVEH